MASGHDGSSLINSVESFDPSTNQWTAAGTLPEIKYCSDAAVLNGNPMENLMLPAKVVPAGNDGALVPTDPVYGPCFKVILKNHSPFGDGGRG